MSNDDDLAGATITVTDNTTFTGTYIGNSYCDSCGQWVIWPHYCPGRTAAAYYPFYIREEDGMTQDEKRELVVLLKQMMKDKQLTKEGYIRLLEHCYLEDL